MNILQLINKFSTQEACVKHLEKVRWGDKIKCVYCGSENNYANEKELRHHCNDCRKSFSVTVGTIFHHTHIELQKWFLVMSLMMNAKKGLSAYQIARDLGMRRATVWSMTHRIRKAMATNQANLLQGIVEMDECYVGGKPRKETKSDNDDNDKGNPRGRATQKEAVVGIVERNGEVRAENVDKNKLNFSGLSELVRKNVDINNSILITDEYRAYSKMMNFIKHETINHSYEYSRKGSDYNIHSNTIESFWALLKRGIIGQFHKVSKKYLNNYIDEFCFRYNQRQNENIFDMLLINCVR
jgi:transposase-like protein